jgi:hypothetical protein
MNDQLSHLCDCHCRSKSQCHFWANALHVVFQIETLMNGRVAKYLDYSTTEGKK